MGSHSFMYACQRCFAVNMIQLSPADLGLQPVSGASISLPDPDPQVPPPDSAVPLKMPSNAVTHLLAACSPMCGVHTGVDLSQLLPAVCRSHNSCELAG